MGEGKIVRRGGGLSGFLAYNYGDEKLNFVGYVNETGSGHVINYVEDTDNVYVEITAQTSSAERRIWIYTEGIDFTNYNYMYAICKITSNDVNKVYPSIAYSASATENPTQIQPIATDEVVFSNNATFLEREYGFAVDISAITGTQVIHIGGDMQRQTANTKFAVFQLLLIR